jgi:hypothetical protein
MTLWNNKGFTENELSLFAKILISCTIIIPLVFITVQSIILGHVKSPSSFVIILFGFSLFLISKISHIRKGTWFSFGTKHMSVRMGNLYRIGYWLMVVGIILAFCD